MMWPHVAGFPAFEPISWTSHELRHSFQLGTAVRQNASLHEVRTSAAPLQLVIECSECRSVTGMLTHGVDDRCYPSWGTWAFARDVARGTIQVRLIIEGRCGRNVLQRLQACARNVYVSHIVRRPHENKAEATQSIAILHQRKNRV